jgi:hypothetical protein
VVHVLVMGGVMTNGSLPLWQLLLVCFFSPDHMALTSIISCLLPPDFPMVVHVEFESIHLFIMLYFVSHLY